MLSRPEYILPRSLHAASLPTSLLFWALCLFCLALSGCGYTLASDSRSVLTEHSGSDRVPTMKVKSVENPTLYPWLPYAVRTEVRNELAARRLVEWVDSGPADYEIELKVVSYTYRSGVYDENDVTQLYSARLTLEATIYQGGTDQVVWRSGPVSESDSRERVEEKVASGFLVQDIARRMADRMRWVF